MEPFNFLFQKLEKKHYIYNRGTERRKSMLNRIICRKLTQYTIKKAYGQGTDLGMGIITAFAIVAIITIVVYKLFNARTGDIQLPGGFKIKFTT